MRDMERAVHLLQTSAEELLKLSEKISAHGTESLTEADLKVLRIGLFPAIEAATETITVNFLTGRPLEWGLKEVHDLSRIAGVNSDY